MIPLSRRDLKNYEIIFHKSIMFLDEREIEILPLLIHFSALVYYLQIEKFHRNIFQGFLIDLNSPFNELISCVVRTLLFNLGRASCSTTDSRKS